MALDLADRGIYGFSTPEHLRFADVDANGHINNGAFLELLENAERIKIVQRKENCKPSTESGRGGRVAEATCGVTVTFGCAQKG